jgi:hypothetical protein
MIESPDDVARRRLPDEISLNGLRRPIEDLIVSNGPA